MNVRPLPLTLVRRSAAALVALCLAAVPALGQNDAGDWNAQDVLREDRYVAPPGTIAEAVLAPRHLNFTLSDANPDRSRFLNEIGDGPVTMDRFSIPFHDLGGVFIDYAANRERRLTIRSNVAIRLTSADDGSTVDVEIPNGARVSDATWTPDGSRVVFFAHFPDGTHIYTADPDNGRSRQLTRRPVLATLNTGFDVSEDGRFVATVLVPERRSAMPTPSAIPTGPELKLTEEGENRLRVFASLLATPHDKALLEWHVTGQVAVIDLENRRVTQVGSPAMVSGLDLSPDGQHLRVTRMVKPFSYIVPVRNFGTVQEVWNLEGEALATLDEEELDLGVADGNPNAPRRDEAPEGRREIAWRADGQGLTFLEQEPIPEEDEATDAGDEEDEGGTKDRVMQWIAPFGEGDLTVLYESDRPISTHRYSPDHTMLFLSERRGQRVHDYAVDLSNPDEQLTLARYAQDDFYANPGTLLASSGEVGGGGRFARFRRGPEPGNGQMVMMSDDGAHVYYVGTQYAEDPMAEAPRGFIDRIAVATGEKERIYNSPNENLSETLRVVLDPEGQDFVVDRESPTQVPQSFRNAGGQLTQLTENQDFTPDLTSMPVERFVVERPDGFKFRVTVNLPPGYQQGTRLPAMFWFYPREYTDQESYDEGARTYNKNAFPNFGPRSMEYLVRLGYAVVEPDAPIIGRQGAMNNNYEHDLRNNLAAVIDELDRRELIDRSRLGIGGHSYGAFSTANAMVHTPFFKAGIAGDGNYNRTLTPLAFQSERRFLWDAKDVYLGMSPFLHANNLTGALLMYHGAHDQNVGTAPNHMPRMFHALNGLGKTAAMYMYPFEDHGPATEETLLDLWARWTAWLEVHLENPMDGTRAVSDR